MFNILLEFLQSHPVLMSQNFEKQGCQWYGLSEFFTYYTRYNNWKMTKLRIKFDPGYYTMV